MIALEKLPLCTILQLHTHSRLFMRSESLYSILISFGMTHLSWLNHPTLNRQNYAWGIFLLLRKRLRWLSPHKQLGRDLWPSPWGFLSSFCLHSNLLASGKRKIFKAFEIMALIDMPTHQINSTSDTQSPMKREILFNITGNQWSNLYPNHYVFFCIVAQFQWLYQGIPIIEDYQDSNPLLHKQSLYIYFTKINIPLQAV